PVGAHRGLLPRRIVRAVRTLPDRNGAATGIAGAPGRRPPAGLTRARAGPAARGRPSHARRVDLRAGPDRLQRHRIGARQAGSLGGTMSQPPVWFQPPPPPSRPPEAPPLPVPRRFTIEIDGARTEVSEGQTILDACRARGIDTPTLCFLETLTPVNVCRVC